MSTLYIRVPSKAAADSVPHWTTLSCPFAFTARGDAIEREGSAALPELADTIAEAQRVVLLLAASDVTLLRIQVPPLSPSRLKAALPNMVEDQIMSDPAECVMVAGPGGREQRVVAVVSRDWLDTLFNAVTSFGARQVHALPSQLCLPWQADMAFAAATREEANVELALRFSEQEGVGLPISPEQPDQSVAEAVQAMCVLVAQAPITLYVPQADVPAYREAVEGAALNERITVHADNWGRWISGAGNDIPDLLADRNAASAGSFDWQTWKWPLALAAAVLFINILALNIDWWRMKSEAKALNRSMTQAFKMAFPNEPTIVDAVAQMKQKIAAARHSAGQLSPDDFLVLSSAFGTAWQQAASGAPKNAVSALEYRDYILTVRFKPGTSLPVDQLKASMTARNLSLSQPSANSLEIRSGK